MDGHYTHADGVPKRQSHTYSLDCPAADQMKSPKVVLIELILRMLKLCFISHQSSFVHRDRPVN